MKLKERMERKIRQEGKSPKTFATYWPHVESFIRFCKTPGGWRSPEECGRDEIERWLTWLANDRHVAASTQNCAMQAVLYLYHRVLGIRIEGLNALRAKRSEHIPDIPSQSELAELFEHMHGVEKLAGLMMYGIGLRVGDLIGLRIKDISFEREQIAVKQTKGNNWRYVSFPKCLHDSVAAQIESVRVLWKHDANDNPNGVSLPDAFRRKSPNAARELRWYWLFPSDCLSKGHEGILCRHHRDPSHIQRKVKEASNKAGILKRITCHTFRHAYACHFVEQGGNMDDLMKLLGHKSLETTRIYMRGRKDGITAAKSPLASLLANPELVKQRRAESEPFKLRVFAG